MKKIGFQRLLAAMGLLVIVLLAAAFILGILSLKRTQEIVSDDFQRQQLILARTTARQMEDGLAFLRRELRTLAYSPAIQYLEDVAWANRMRLSFEELSRLGVTAIDAHQRRRRTRPTPWTPAAPGWSAGGFQRAPGRGLGPGPGQPGPHLPGAHPGRGTGRSPRSRSWTWPPRSTARAWTSPIPGRPAVWTGCCSSRSTSAASSAPTAPAIRSGRTGYCWVMDQAGLFLYHPERDFIGQDAFTARGRRNPPIDFGAINEIQKSKMAAGEEGTSRYTSGWHRGVIGQMEKFLAYAPAQAGAGRRANLVGGGGGAHGRGLRHHPLALRAAVSDPGPAHLCPDLRRRGHHLLRIPLVGGVAAGGGPHHRRPAPQPEAVQVGGGERPGPHLPAG